MSLELSYKSESTREECEWCISKWNPLVFIGLVRWCSVGNSGGYRQNRLQKRTRDRHVEAEGEGSHLQFGQTRGTAFSRVAGRWAPRSWVATKLRRFGPVCRPLDPCACTWLAGCLSLGLCLLFSCILSQIHLHTYLDQHLWKLLDRHPILVLVRAFIPSLCRNWQSKLVCNERQ
jgi:hypothetical protein